MLVGYVRVSTADERQSTDLQRDALRAAGIDERHVHEDRASGGRDDRPGLKACLEYLTSGDVLVVWRLDRLGRSLPHLVGIVADLRARGVGLRSLTELIDTTTATGELVFTSSPASPSTSGRSSASVSWPGWSGAAPGPARRAAPAAGRRAGRGGAGDAGRRAEPGGGGPGDGRAPLHPRRRAAPRGRLASGDPARIASAAEVEAAHVVVVRQLGRGAGEADAAGLQDIGAAADLQRHARVLLDQDDARPCPRG